MKKLLLLFLPISVFAQTNLYENPDFDRIETLYGIGYKYKAD